MYDTDNGTFSADAKVKMSMSFKGDENNWTVGQTYTIELSGVNSYKNGTIVVPEGSWRLFGQLDNPEDYVDISCDYANSSWKMTFKPLKSSDGIEYAFYPTGIPGGDPCTINGVSFDFIYSSMLRPAK